MPWYTYVLFAYTFDVIASTSDKTTNKTAIVLILLVAQLRPVCLRSFLPESLEDVMESIELERGFSMVVFCIENDIT